MIRSSGEVPEKTAYRVLVYGKPGSGKSTLACSANNPLLIDTDKGFSRIHLLSRPSAYIQPESYQEIIDDMKNPEFMSYDTIVVDTLGRLLELMTIHAGTVNPKLRQSDGDLTMKGWGWLAKEFTNFVQFLYGMNKNVVFVAHAVEEQDGDTKVYRIDAGGKAKKEIFKDMDIVGFMETVGQSRMINFAQNERYYTKNSIGITDFEPLPNILKGDKNDYLKNLFLRAKNKESEDAKVAVQYRKLMAQLESFIEGVTDAETAGKALDHLNEAEQIWGSKNISKKMLNDKCKKIGVEYDREKRVFVNSQPAQ